MHIRYFCFQAALPNEGSPTAKLEIFRVKACNLGCLSLLRDALKIREAF